MTFNIVTERVSEPTASITISSVKSGHIVTLSPGIYNITIVSLSGIQQVSSIAEQIFIMNSKSVESFEINDYNVIFLILLLICMIFSQNHVLHMSE